MFFVSKDISLIMIIIMHGHTDVWKSHRYGLFPPLPFSQQITFVTIDDDVKKNEDSFCIETNIRGVGSKGDVLGLWIKLYLMSSGVSEILKNT